MDQLRDTLINEAAEWFARLQDADAADRRDFDAWMLRSPSHIEAYLKVSRAWGDMDLSEAPATAELISAADEENAASNVVMLEAQQDATWRMSRSRIFRP